jgi:hypothetical protein
MITIEFGNKANSCEQNDHSLKCSDVRTFLSQIFEKQGRLDSALISQADLDFLSSNGYILVMQKADYDQAAAEVAKMEEVNQRLAQEKAADIGAQKVVTEDEKKVHGLFFGLHGQEYKEAARQKLEADKDTLSKDEVPLSEDEARISNYIQRKSVLDQLVPYGDEYLSLTGSGVVMLNALSARTSRVSDMEFSDFVQETKETDVELRGIAQRASLYVSEIRDRITFPSQMS